MKKIGKFNLIEINGPCEESCKCGWSLTIGGKETKDLEIIKEYLTTINDHEHEFETAYLKPYAKGCLVPCKVDGCEEFLRCEPVWRIY